MSKVVIGIGTLCLILLILLGIKNKKLLQLEAELEESKNLNREIKDKLRQLIESNTDLDPGIINELSQIMNLIDMKHDTKAILSLVKIVEKLLHDLYEGEPALLKIATDNGRKRPAFMDYLELALETKAISKEDFHLMSVAKIVRDKEAHEINFEKEKVTILSSFVSAIGIVWALWRLLKAKILLGKQARLVEEGEVFTI